jgi:hypothetical protein
MDEFSDFVGDTDDWYDADDEIVLIPVNPPLLVDPILFAGICIGLGFLLVAILLGSFDLFFGPNLSRISQNTSNQSRPKSEPNENSQNLGLIQTLQKDIGSECEINPGFPEKINRWCSLITFYANKHNLDPDLVASVVWLESGGNEQAYSRSGAVGLMQIMPRDGLASSFMCINGPCFKDRPSTTELKDPEFNIAYGTQFLAGLVKRKGNLREALKSYGPMDAGYTYSDKVLSIFDSYNGN